MEELGVAILQFEPRRRLDVAQLGALLEAGSRQVGTVDAVVLPEPPLMRIR